MEKGEDILTAARREFLEETGLTADLWLCGVIVVETGRNPDVGIYVFTGACPHGEPVPSEEGDLEWVSLSKLKELPVVEDLTGLTGSYPGDENWRSTILCTFFL